MYHIAASRFNNRTWQENTEWRKNYNYVGCIYCAPGKIKDSISNGNTIFVLEMHNDENKIKGIGVINKYERMDKYYPIYAEGNFNRFTYKSPYRLDIGELDCYDRAIVEIFDTLLFKSKKHIKRAQGITELPQWIVKNKQFDFIIFFRELFKKKFPEAFTEKKEL